VANLGIYLYFLQPYNILKELKVKRLIWLVVAMFSTMNTHANEFGVALVGLSSPHYMGSDESHNLVFPIPLFSSMFEQEKKERGLYLSYSANFNLPVGAQSISDTDKENNLFDFDNFSRRGMESIPLTFFLGAKAGYKVGSFDLAVHITPGLQIGNNWNGAGLLYKAEVTWHLTKLGLTEVIVVTNATFGDSRYNNLYYGVKSKDVIEKRSLYKAKSGHLGSSIALHYHTWKPINSLIFGFFIEYQNMSGSTVEDSPLVQNKNNTLGGAGVGLLF
jgi:outer membrane scaffolding protein for murein synthesis (MipA/OmpV family)